MSRLRVALASTVGRVATVVALLLGAVTVAPMFSGAVSAHKAGVSAEVACDGTVSWTVKSWSEDSSGANPDVRVMERDDGSGGSTDHEVGKGSFGDAQGYRFSGTFAWPAGASKVTVSSKPVGEWSSGHESDDSDSVELTKRDDCDHHPDVEHEVKCEDSAPGYGEGMVDMTLSNPAGPFGHSVDYEVDSPDHSGTETHHVAAGEREHVVYHHLDDGHHTIHVHDGDKDMSYDVEVHCDQAVPSVTKSQACVDGKGSITVNLANTGGAAVTFTVEDPTTHHVETITLDPDGNASRTFAGLANGEYTVKVHAGDRDLSQHFEVDCEHDDHHQPHAEGKIEVAKMCVDHDGQVTVTLIAKGDSGSVTFVVEGHTYVVPAGSTQQAVVAGLTDGEHAIHVTADGEDLSFDVEIHCDLSPRVTVSQQCVAFHGQASLLLENLGDDTSATFTINGVDHVVAPGASDTVVIDGLPDGPTHITLAINGYTMPDVVVSFACAPEFRVVAECNTVDAHGAPLTYWYTITNTEAVDVPVTWDLGSTVVPAGESRTIGSDSATLALLFDGHTIATADASESACSRSVTVQKTLIGAPAAPETYKVTISRLVDDAYVDITTFDLVAGTPVTVNLPSTMDPAGIQYKVAEVARGTANTTVVTPDVLTLSGNLGATISVTVTNGYAGVSLAKQASAAQVGVGSQFSYTLAATNTNGLTLDPTVVLDRLPTNVSFVSATVAAAGGTCTLTQAAHPQLVSCTLAAPLKAGQTSPTITITVTVDAAASVGSQLSNQAKVVGAFAEAASAAEAPGAPLSCVPVVDGTVCALSAAVNTPVVAAEPPTVPPTSAPGTTTTVAQGGPLPSTGSNSLSLVYLAAGVAGLGAVLASVRRRRRPAR